MKFFLCIAGAGIFGFASYRVQWLSMSGSITASLFGFSLLYWGGWPWIVPVLVFFGTSSLLSKLRRPGQEGQGKSEDVRNGLQVLANGGVAWFFLSLYVVGSNPLWIAGFGGALAAATADTWGTEIGRLARGRTVSVLTGRPVVQGTSGGISWQGTLAGACGAALLAGTCLIGFPEHISFVEAGMLTFAGVLASLVDSLLGATVQARYLNPETCEISERKTSDGMQLHTGWRWMTNDTVNLCCTTAGALVAMGFG